MPPHWKTVWQSLKRLDVALPWNAAIPRLGMYSRTENASWLPGAGVKGERGVTGTGRGLPVRGDENVVESDCADGSTTL